MVWLLAVLVVLVPAARLAWAGDSGHDHHASVKDHRASPSGSRTGSMTADRPVVVSRPGSIGIVVLEDAPCSTSVVLPSPFVPPR